MSRHSTINDHPHRLEIERALAAGDKSIRQIAESFGVSPRALRHHAEVRIAPAIRKAAVKRESTTGNAVLDEINTQVAGLREMLDAATRDIRGPDGQIDFSLRARDAECVYDFTTADESGKLRTTRRRATLQELIDKERGIVSVTVRKDSTPGLFAKLSSVLRDYLETVAKLTGLVSTGDTTNIQINLTTSAGRDAYKELPFESWMIYHRGPVNTVIQLYERALGKQPEDVRQRFLEDLAELIEAEGGRIPPADDDEGDSGDK